MNRRQQTSPGDAEHSQGEAYFLPAMPSSSAWGFIASITNWTC